MADILSQIFEYVYMDYNGPADTAALAATCRAFHNPALYLLWRYLPSLVPLVKCLPHDTYEIVRYRPRCPQETIVRSKPLLLTRKLTNI